MLLSGNEVSITPSTAVNSQMREAKVAEGSAT